MSNDGENPLATQGWTAEEERVGWAIMQGLHSHLTEETQPTGWTDLSGDQLARIKAAAQLVIKLHEPIVEKALRLLERRYKTFIEIGSAKGNAAADMVRADINAILTLTDTAPPEAEYPNVKAPDKNPGDVATHDLETCSNCGQPFAASRRFRITGKMP